MDEQQITHNVQVLNRLRERGGTSTAGRVGLVEVLGAVGITTPTPSTSSLLSLSWTDAQPCLLALMWLQKGKIHCKWSDEVPSKSEMASLDFFCPVPEPAANQGYISSPPSKVRSHLISVPCRAILAYLQTSAQGQVCAHRYTTGRQPWWAMISTKLTEIFF